MPEEPAFDPRLSMIDLYDTWDLAKAAAKKAGRKMPDEAMKAVEAEIARRKKDGLL